MALVLGNLAKASCLPSLPSNVGTTYHPHFKDETTGAHTAQGTAGGPGPRKEQGRGARWGPSPKACKRYHYHTVREGARLLSSGRERWLEWEQGRVSSACWGRAQTSTLHHLGGLHLTRMLFLTIGEDRGSCVTLFKEKKTKTHILWKSKTIGMPLELLPSAAPVARSGSGRQTPITTALASFVWPLPAHGFLL